jgi:hypothetical protein
MKIVAIDPGPHTGIFWMENDKPHRITFDYTDPVMAGEPHKHLYMWLMQMINPGLDILICESFEFRKEDARKREYIDYSPGELVGVVKLFSQLTETPLTMQMASLAKSGFWNDDKLRRVGLWIAGSANRHVRDATRHWLYFNSFILKDDTWLHKLK